MSSSDMEIQVIEFQKEYPSINLDLMKNNPKNYDMAIIAAYTVEVEKGYIVKKVGKTYKKGTKFTYKPCESEKEAKKYREKLEELLNDYNKKYGTNYAWN